ncbi:MAG: alpha-galactosidase [Pseudomonadota bacterium]
MNCWRLDDARQTLVLAADSGRLPEITYWGPRLPQDEDLTLISRSADPALAGGMLDAAPDLSICPEATQTFPGQPGMQISTTDGLPLLPAFRMQSADDTDGLTLTFGDADAGLTYTARFAIDADTHIITASASLTSAAPIVIGYVCAPVFPAPHQAKEMIDFHGKWCGEFKTTHTPWSAGIRARDNRTGRTGHEHFPGLIIPEDGCTNTQGAAYGFTYGWSGGHRMVAEEMPDGRRQVQFSNASQSEPVPVTEFHTAPLYVTYSDHGLNGCATAFQRHLRDRILTMPDPARPRPVHYNCWEAIYFDHDLDTLREIADRAADLGAERFVLDDGWFGKRDNDTSSLGDWTIDRRKWPDGLTPLIDHVKGLGMTFGLWFEPEMVNPDSDLYRENPDWALGRPDQILGRNQMVLDMAMTEVREYLYDHIAGILRDHDIDYIKWDHNRVLPHADAEQARGAYALLDRLRADFPEVEIESCASGGGRIDFGILERTHRVWLSDSNDALERLRIQHNSALFLPTVVTGSHVGPRTCHTSGRILPMGFRAWVAAQRHLGFEMDPRELDDRETHILKTVTAWYKDNRDWLHQADILRLDSPDPAVIAEQQTARDASRFVVFAGRADTSDQISPRPLRLTQLDAQARYKVRMISPPVQNAPAAPHLCAADGMEVSGAWLMTQGLTFPNLNPTQMWVIEGHVL